VKKTTTLMHVKQFLKRITIVVKTWHYSRYLFYRYLCEGLIKNSYELKNVNIFDVGLSSKSNSFFGYYNISPFNEFNDNIIFCETNSESYGNEIDIVVYNLTSKTYKKVAKTNSWNWQQGCMLQWFPNRKDEIIYNNYNNINDSYCSIILNITTGKESIINRPIYCLSDNGLFALTLNFDRLRLLRPDYGYFNKKECIIDDSSDGIWYVDLKKNNTTLIISIDELKTFLPDPSMEGAKHKVNHIDISPNNKRFMFYHRWFNNGKKFTRLLTADIDGKNLFLICGNEMVSHCTWKSNDVIVGYAYNKRLGYFEFIDQKNNSKSFYNNYLNKDGHPSFSVDRNWFITDSYPNRSRFSSLLLINLKKRELIKLGKFYQPLKYNLERRIDLHPRWDYYNKYLSFDSGHSGKRRMYIMNIENLTNNQQFSS